MAAVLSSAVLAGGCGSGSGLTVTAGDDPGGPPAGGGSLVVGGGGRGPDEQGAGAGEQPGGTGGGGSGEPGGPAGEPGGSGGGEPAGAGQPGDDESGGGDQPGEAGEQGESGGGDQPGEAEEQGEPGGGDQPGEPDGAGQPGDGESGGDEGSGSGGLGAGSVGRTGGGEPSGPGDGGPGGDGPVGPVGVVEGGDDVWAPLFPGDYDVPWDWLVNGRAVVGDDGGITFPGGKFGSFWSSWSRFEAVVDEIWDVCDDVQALAAVTGWRLGPGEELDDIDMEKIEHFRWSRGVSCEPGGKRYVYVTDDGPGPPGVSPDDAVAELNRVAQWWRSQPGFGGPQKEPPGHVLGYVGPYYHVDEPADDVVVLADTVTVDGSVVRGLVQNRSRGLWARDVVVSAGGLRWEWPLTMQPWEVAPFEIEGWAGAANPAAVDLQVTASLSSTVDIKRALGFKVYDYWRQGSWEEYLELHNLPAFAVPDPPEGEFVYITGRANFRAVTSHPELEDQIMNQAIDDLRAYVAFTDLDGKVVDVLQAATYKTDWTGDTLRPVRIDQLPDPDHPTYAVSNNQSFDVGFLGQGDGAYLDLVWLGGAN